MRDRQIILASASVARRRMLEQSGVSAEIVIADIDEDALTETLKRELAPPENIATCLARMKALRVSRRRPGRFVIGCDQILVADGKMFGKAGSKADARETLLSLRGRAHRLLSAAVVVIDGQRVWQELGSAKLIMRAFTDEFLEGYLKRNWPKVQGCVGCYQLEDEGAQLFAHVEGDIFSIMGMPLLELLEYLRVRGVLEQ